MLIRVACCCRVVYTSSSSNSIHLSCLRTRLFFLSPRSTTNNLHYNHNYTTNDTVCSPKMPSTTKQTQSQQTTTSEGVPFGPILPTGHFAQNSFFSSMNQEGSRINAVAGPSRGVGSGMRNNGLQVCHTSYVECGWICVPLLSVLALTQIILAGKQRPTNRAFVREKETSRI